MMSEILAIRVLLPERHAEMGEQGSGFLVGARRGHDVDVHASDLVDLVVDDLGKDELLPQAERVVAAAVEALRRHALEVTDAGQGDVDQPVEKLVHPRSAERDLRSDGHAFPELEIRDRLLGPRDDRLLPADRLQVRGGEVEDLGVVAPFADAHVDDDLVEPRDLPRIRVSALLEESRDDRLMEALLEARGDLSRALGTGLGGGGGAVGRFARLAFARRLSLLLRSSRFLGGCARCFRHALALVDRFAAAAAHANLAAVGQHLDTRARRLVAAGTHEQHVGERQGALPLDDAALPQLLRGPLVLLHHVDLLDDHPPGHRQHAQDLAPLAALPAGDDGDRVSSAHVRHHSTSGASEMIFVNCRSRSSRATGPKIRVPTGFSSGLIRTTAFRSNRMYEPSLRRTSLTVRTTTARATSPFLTVPSGAASLTATITVSPSEA